MWQRLISSGALILFVVAVFFVAIVPSQNEFLLISCGYGLAFICYLYLVFGDAFRIDGQVITFKTLLGLAIIIKLGLIFTFPQLSDDLYRFIWDGNLLQAGLNPYSSLPSEILPQGIAGNDIALYAQLNSPNYYTIYPPITQIVYFIASAMSDDYYICNLVMKLFNTLGELGILYLLIKLLGILQIDKSRVFIYALNPLVLIELGANLHMESIMIFFFLLGILYLHQQKMLKMGFAIAAGVGSKLLPMMFLPFIWKYAGLSKEVFFKVAFACILIFLPLFFGLEWLKFGQSVDLYFGKFEFNGGIYVLLRYLGEVLSGFNLIRFLGPGMALITIGLIAKLFFIQKERNLTQLIHFSFYAICTYYFFSTTVHPWYLSLPLALSCFTRYRFVVLWSGLIILSYINYSYNPYQENLWITAIEYIAVFTYLIYEIKKGDQ